MNNESYLKEIRDVCIHEMNAELGAGPVYTKIFYDIAENTYIGDPYDFTDSRIPKLFAQTLTEIEMNGLTATPQSEEQVLRCYPRLPEDSALDWSLPAETLARIVRASSKPFAGAYAMYKESPIVIWRAKAEKLPFQWMGTPGQVAERRADGSVAVLTGQDVLVLELVQRRAGIPVPAADVITSNRDRLYSGEER